MYQQLAETTEVNKLDTIFKYAFKVYQHGFFEDAYKVALQGQEIATKVGDFNKICQLQIIESRYLARTNQVDKAIDVISEVIRDKCPYYLESRPYVHNLYSNMLMVNNELDDALKEQFYADSISKVMGTNRYSGLLNRVDIYLKLGLKDLALETGDLSFELAQTEADTSNLLFTCFQLAQLSAELDGSVNYAKYAKKYIEVSAQRNMKYHKGIFDLDFKSKEAKITAFENVLKTYIEEDFKRGIQLTTFYLIPLLIEDQQYKKAYNYLTKIEDEIMMNGFENSIYETLQNKYFLEKYFGKTDKALQTADRLMALRDTMQNLAITKQSLDLATKYKTKEKEQEIIILNKENELKDLSIRRSNVIKTLLLLGLSLLGFLTYSLFRNVRERKKHNRILKEKNDIIQNSLIEKENLLKEIHHRVKNNLQIISSLLRLQSRSIQDESTKEVLLEGQNRVQSMSLIHEELYKENENTGVDVKSYFEKLCHNLIQTYKLDTRNIKLNLDIEPIQLDISTLIPLGLMVNELFTNSLKYAFQNQENPILGAELIEDNQMISLRIYDNGIGITDEMVDYLNDRKTGRNDSWGFGTRLIKTFANKLDARMEANNKEGTEIQFYIKDYKIIK